MRESKDGILRVEIDGSQYSIRCKAGSEDHINMLADYVDTMMRQVRQKTGHISRDNIAIMAALNIAERMVDERERYGQTVRSLIDELDDTLEGVVEIDGEPSPQDEAEEDPDGTEVL